MVHMHICTSEAESAASSLLWLAAAGTDLLLGPALALQAAGRPSLLDGTVGDRYGEDDGVGVDPGVDQGLQLGRDEGFG